MALLVACGGGGSEGGAAAAAQYEGTISGFGSVIVNGVRFDDSRAAVTIDDADVAVGALKLGMRVALSGAVADGADTGTATQVTVETAARGPVASVDLGNSTFTIRGITIQTDAKTVFEGASDLAALHAGDWVEAHGSVDFANRLVQATRVEVKAPEDVGRIVLFGKATGVTASTFTLGDLTVNYASAQLIGFGAGGIAEGSVVRVRANEAPVNNLLTATFVKAVKAPRLLDGTPAAVEGRIQQFAGASDFLVSGTAVDASNATFENGVIGDLAEGKRVIVRGTLANGKVMARKVRFFLPDQDGEVRLIGLVSDDLSIASFKVRGVAVDASNAQFSNGDASQLANSRLVQIKGQAVGSLVTATSVEFLDSNALLGLLTGVVSDANSTADFKVGGQAAKVGLVVRYINGNAAGIVNGATLWMKGHRDGAGVFVANVVFIVPNWMVVTTQAAGTVTDPDPLNHSFKLNGTTVTTSPATVFIGGTEADLLTGRWVIVTGKMNSGVLAAETIIVTRDHSNEACKAFKLDAVIYDYVSVSNFKLFGFQIDASTAAFSGGSAADLADGKVIQACGDALPAGNVLTAKSILFLSAP
ncbi:MAG: DUF5666 domain-containing protein [Burkholderiaceae bacterium]